MERTFIALPMGTTNNKKSETFVYKELQMFKE